MKSFPEILIFRTKDSFFDLERFSNVFAILISREKGILLGVPIYIPGVPFFKLKIMNNNKISILFLLQKARINKQGKCPIRCRITFNEGRQEFATGLLIDPNTWYSKLQLVKPPNEENNFVNTQLSLIKNKINQAFLYLQMKGSDFDVDDLFLIYKGEKPKKEKGVLEVYNEYNNKIKKLIGKDIELVTYNKYLESYKHLKDYIKFNFNSTDIKLKDVKNNFLNDYDYYLKTQKGKNKQGLNQSTINKAIQRFRKTLKYAISEGYLEKDPFVMYSAKVVKKHVVFLTKEELLKVEKHQFSTGRIQSIKELFIFCCYTGLAFKEMSLLKKSDIITGFDGNLWIVVNRSKTDRDYKVPLLPTAQKILQSYKNENSDLLFPKISNQKFNEYLKEIAGVTGISKNLTHHIARKTFASTVLLYNDVPMEVVSELLGHSKLSTTQEHYAKVVQNKVSQHITELGKKLS
jgi:site-specific recombinase XerD